MFDAKSMLFIYVEQNLHAGVGRGFGAIDLPIQRDRSTGYPILQAGGIKGKLRYEANLEGSSIQAYVPIIFGPDTQPDHAGALSIGDAQILLFPIRSLNGVFAWVTCLDVLNRFCRIAAATGIPFTPALIPGAPTDTDKVKISPQSEITSGDFVALEDFAFPFDRDQKVQELGEWLANNALPDGDEYKYWKTHLPKKLCLVSDEIFADFVQFFTDVQFHNRLDPVKKTVITGALWATESLPIDTVMYAPLMSTPPRIKSDELDSANKILEKFKKFIKDDLKRVQLGGDETTGQGLVALKYWERVQ